MHLNSQKNIIVIILNLIHCILLFILCFFYLKVITIFNCAPAVQYLNSEFYALTDILVVNESEAEALAKFPVINLEDAKRACNYFLAQDGFSLGVCVTMGENGCFLGDRLSQNSVTHFKTKKINPIDSTGAGDAFTGSLAHYLSRFQNVNVESLHKSIELAVEYASLTVERKGSQASYLRVNELDEKFKF
jgi:ribokinase